MSYKVGKKTRRRTKRGGSDDEKKMMLEKYKKGTEVSYRKFNINIFGVVNHIGNTIKGRVEDVDENSSHYYVRRKNSDGNRYTDYKDSLDIPDKKTETNYELKVLKVAPRAITKDERTALKNKYKKGVEVQYDGWEETDDPILFGKVYNGIEDKPGEDDSKILVEDNKTGSKQTLDLGYEDSEQYYGLKKKGMFGSYRGGKKTRRRTKRGGWDEKREKEEDDEEYKLALGTKVNDKEKTALRNKYKVGTPVKHRIGTGRNPPELSGRIIPLEEDEENDVFKITIEHDDKTTPNLTISVYRGDKSFEGYNKLQVRGFLKNYGGKKTRRRTKRGGKKIHRKTNKRRSRK